MHSCLQNITLGSCTVAFEILRDNGTYEVFDGNLLAKEYCGVIRNPYFQWGVSTGDFSSRADVMRWFSVPTPWSVHSCYRLKHLLLIPSVFIWILHILRVHMSCKKSISSFSETYCKGQYLWGHQLRAGVATPSSVQLCNLNTLTLKVRT